MTENLAGIRGAAPVGLVQVLTPDEALCIRYLRLWWAGPEAQAEIWNEFFTKFRTNPRKASVFGV